MVRLDWITYPKFQFSLFISTCFFHTFFSPHMNWYGVFLFRQHSTIGNKRHAETKNYEFEIFVCKCPFWRSLTASTMSKMSWNSFLCLHKWFFFIKKKKTRANKNNTHQSDEVESGFMFSILAPQSTKGNSQWINFPHSILLYCFSTERFFCLVIIIQNENKHQTKNHEILTECLRFAAE